MEKKAAAETLQLAKRVSPAHSLPNRGTLVPHIYRGERRKKKLAVGATFPAPSDCCQFATFCSSPLSFPQMKSVNKGDMTRSSPHTSLLPKKGRNDGFSSSFFAGKRKEGLLPKKKMGLDLWSSFPRPCWIIAVLFVTPFFTEKYLHAPQFPPKNEGKTLFSCHRWLWHCWAVLFWLLFWCNGWPGLTFSREGKYGHFWPFSQNP